MLSKAAVNDLRDAILDINDINKQSDKVQGSTKYIENKYAEMMKIGERKDEFDKEIEASDFNKALLILNQKMSDLNNDDDY